MPPHSLRPGVCHYEPPTPEPPVFTHLDASAHPAGATAYVTSGTMKSHTSHDTGMVSAVFGELFGVSADDGGATAARPGAAILANRVSMLGSLATDPSYPTATADAPQRIVAYAESPEDGIAGVSVYIEIAPHDYGDRAEVTTLRFGVIADSPDGDGSVRAQAESALEWINRRTKTSIGDELFEQEAPAAQRIEGADALPKIEASIASLNPGGAGSERAANRTVAVENPFGPYREELTDALHPIGRFEPGELAEHIIAPTTLPATLVKSGEGSVDEAEARDQKWAVTGITTFALPFGRACQPVVVSIEVGPD